MMETIVAHAGNKERWSREQADDFDAYPRPHTDHCFCIAARTRLLRRKDAERPLWVQKGDRRGNAPQGARRALLFA